MARVVFVLARFINGDAHVSFGKIVQPSLFMIGVTLQIQAYTINPLSYINTKLSQPFQINSNQSSGRPGSYVGWWVGGFSSNLLKLAWIFLLDDDVISNGGLKYRTAIFNPGIDKHATRAACVSLTVRKIRLHRQE
jgi:hypothetical protein